MRARRRTQKEMRARRRTQNEVGLGNALPLMAKGSKAHSKGNEGSKEVRARRRTQKEMRAQRRTQKEVGLGNALPLVCVWYCGGCCGCGLKKVIL